MKNQEFEKIYEDTVKRERSTLIRKAGEYARGDRLSNFKLAGLRQEITPEKALEGMLEKHLVSIHDLIKDIDAGKLASIEMIQEKIGDARNYLLLLEALLMDRHNGCYEEKTAASGLRK